MNPYYTFYNIFSQVFYLLYNLSLPFLIQWNLDNFHKYQIYFYLIHLQFHTQVYYHNLADVVQVAILVIGGFATSYLALDLIGGEAGALSGLGTLIDNVPDHFTMILDKDNSQYSNLPGIAVLIGGMWVANLYYWGFNQYIIQRTFAAKSIDEAQKGLAFAAFLKCITPILVVIPGITAYYITASHYNIDDRRHHKA